MIVFQVTRGLPATLTSSDLNRLGKLLGTNLRLRKDLSVALAFLSEKAIQDLNKKYRRINRPTDVLSFETSSVPMPKTRVEKGELVHLGDVFICPAYAKREAKRRVIDEREELIRLCVHGVLHLMGMDHAKPADELKMFRLQEQCVEAFLNRL